MESLGRNFSLKNRNLTIATASKGSTDAWQGGRNYLKLPRVLVKHLQRQVLHTNNRQGTEDMNFNGNWASRVLETFGNVVFSLSRTLKSPHLIFLYSWGQKELCPGYTGRWAIKHTDAETITFRNKIVLCMNTSKQEGLSHHQFCNGKLISFTCHMALKFWQKDLEGAKQNPSQWWKWPTWYHLLKAKFCTHYDS